MVIHIKQQNRLICIGSVMCLCVSLVFFMTSPVEVFAEESEGGLTVGLGPWGVGIDLGTVVFMVGGDFDFDRRGSDEKTTTVDISPLASLKLFMRRATLSPYFHVEIAKGFRFAQEESDRYSSTWLGVALGLEYSVAKNLSFGGDVGLRYYNYSSNDWGSTSVGSTHGFTLRFIF